MAPEGSLNSQTNVGTGGVNWSDVRDDMRDSGYGKTIEQGVGTGVDGVEQVIEGHEPDNSPMPTMTPHDYQQQMADEAFNWEGEWDWADYAPEDEQEGISN